MGNESGGHSSDISVGKDPVSLGDLLDSLSSGSRKMKHLFEISKGSPLHTTHADSASE